MKWPSHGSNPQYLYEAMGLSIPYKTIDFSANINPLGPSAALKEKWNELFHEIHVYPDPFAKRLKYVIAEMEQIQPTKLLIGNGGAELISLVGRMLSGKKVLIVQPTFSEYEKACLANNCEVVSWQLNEPDFALNLADLEGCLTEVEALFLCNPNNPTGVHYPASTVLSLIDLCKKQNCLVILDEAFYDFLPDYDSFIPYVNRYSNLVILRSMTKMFAIPGLRLGYLAAAPNIVSELGRIQSHWSVNTIALRAGEVCLQNTEFIKATQDFIKKERKRLFTFFNDHDFSHTYSKVNFYLLRDSHLNDQFSLFEFLLNKGIVPRHTFNFPGLDGNWLRFAIKSKAENDHLMEVLSEWR